jgi:hypothetical protein
MVSHNLHKQIFDKKIGIFAAAIAITSPNMWFHGEVAFTYIEIFDISRQSYLF